MVVHVHIVGGEATRAALTLMSVLDTCVSQGSSRPVLERIIRRADTAAAFTHTASLCGNGRSMLRCVARGIARGESGGPWPPTVD